MTQKRTLTYLVLGMLVIAAGGFLAGRSFSAASTTVSALAKETHFHGIAVDPSDPSRVYLATHHGLYTIAPDGSANRISATTDDFMGFTPHPSNPLVLYASGHPASGGNLGFIASRDRGKSWAKLADGVGGPVDFHQMDVSKADPKVIYGVHRGLQRSADGGRTWSKVGPAPDSLIDIAASGKNADTLYAATKSGLLKSADGGRSWKSAHIIKRPATMVQVGGRGEIYAFIFGTGLVRADDGGVNWRLVSNAFGGAYVLHLAADKKNGRKIYAVTFNPQTRAQAVVMSKDKGASWAPLGVD
jgi:photosystem II stability/assembly factor-like uncharacterized protein